MRGIVLSLCDYTTNMVEPWHEAGYECWCVDLQHPEGMSRNAAGVNLVGADILTWEPKPFRYAIVFSFPPCTHLAVSGARWFRQKGMAKLIEALSIVERCRVICEEIGAPYLIENPVSTLSTYWRKPDYTFDPYEYGDPWTKRTCLWTGNGFVMPPKSPVAITEPGKIHRMPPSTERANLRSETPPGFARAVFTANT